MLFEFRCTANLNSYLTPTLSVNPVVSLTRICPGNWRYWRRCSIQASETVEYDP